MENIKLIGVCPKNIEKNGRINRFELLEPSAIGGSGAGSETRNDVPKIYLQRSPLYEYYEGFRMFEFSTSQYEYAIEADITDKSLVIDKCVNALELLNVATNATSTIYSYCLSLISFAQQVIDNNIINRIDVQNAEQWFSAIIDAIDNTEYDDNFILNWLTGEDSHFRLLNNSKVVADVRICPVFAPTNISSRSPFFQNFFSDVYAAVDSGNTVPDIPTWQNFLNKSKQSLEESNSLLNFFRSLTLSFQYLSEFFSAMSNSTNQFYIDSCINVAREIGDSQERITSAPFNAQTTEEALEMINASLTDLYFLTKIAINIPIDIYYENPTFINLPEPEQPLPSPLLG